MKKWLPLVLIMVIGLVIFLVKKNRNPSDPTGPTPVSINRERGFDRRLGYIKYSKHASCRMQCREVSAVEVEEIMKNGKINYRKSDLQNARCPRYALEGITADKQKVRIVFAQCEESTVVVTVIDLDTEFACDCPGDDDKSKNRN